MRFKTPQAASSNTAMILEFPLSGQYLRAFFAPLVPTLNPISIVQTPAVPQSFEAALAELEEIVATMEGGQLPLKESLAAYQRGAELLAYCQSALKDAQLQVEVLEKGVLKAFTPNGAIDAS